MKASKYTGFKVHTLLILAITFSLFSITMHSKAYAASSPMQAVNLGIDIFVSDYIPVTVSGEADKDIASVLEKLDSSKHIAVHADTLNRFTSFWQKDVESIKKLKIELLNRSADTGNPRFEFDIPYLCGAIAMNSDGETAIANAAEARERFARLITRNFSDPWPRLFGALVLASLREAGIMEEGEANFYKDLESTVFNAGDDPMLNFLTGEAFKYIGYTNPAAHKIAAIQYEKSLALMPENRRLIEIILSTYNEFTGIYEMYNAAVPFWLEEHILLKTLMLEPDNAIAHNNLSYLYTMLDEKKSEALAHARKAVELDNTNPSFLDTFGWALYRNSMLEEAEGYIRKSLELKPDYTSALSHLSMMLIENKRESEAIPLYEKLLNLDPDNATAMNNLGFILADMSLDIDRALVLCRQAVDLEPENPVFLDSLAWAFYRHGEYQEAIEILVKISAEKDADPAFISHLAMVQEESGDLAGALESLKTLIRLQPDWPDALDSYARIWNQQNVKVPSDN